MADEDTLILTTHIVASYLGGEHHRTPPSEIPDLIRAVRTALAEASASVPTEAATEAALPKATKREISKSITPDALISFIDRKPYKTLKRHLTGHGMDMTAYRERYGLPSDYPSVAPNYSAARSAMAKSLGLGARRKTAMAEPTVAAQAEGKPSGRGRKKTPAPGAASET